MQCVLAAILAFGVLETSLFTQKEGSILTRKVTPFVDQIAYIVAAVLVHDLLEHDHAILLQVGFVEGLLDLVHVSQDPLSGE